VLTGSVGFEQRDVKDIVDFPFPGQCEADGQWGDDFFDLKGTMVLVLQLLRGAACFDVAPVEHYQVSYLVSRGFLPRRVGVSLHSLLCVFQSFPGFVVYGVHPVGIDLACQVQGFRCRGVHGHWVAAVVGVKRRHTIVRGGRVVVGELSHWQQAYPVVLFLADERWEVGFDCLVAPFRLSIGLRMERG